MEKKRLYWIDIAKGICMIAVILGHLGVDKLGFVYSFHLTGFFLLSGFTMRKVKISAEYIKNKFGRLMAPYFTTCFFVTVMEAVLLILNKNFSHNAFTQLVYNNVLRTFFGSGTIENMGETYFGRNIGAIWFLPAMFFAIIFTQIILNATENKKIQVALSVAVAVTGCLTAKFIWLPFSIQSAMLTVPFILAGIYIKEYDVINKLKPIHYSGLLIIFILGCLTGKAQIFYLVTCAVGDWLITPVCAFASALLVIGLSTKISRCKPLEYIGKNSMIYLCVHLFEWIFLTPYYYKFIDYYSLPNRTITRFILEFITINVISVIVITFNNRKKKERKPLKLAGNRDLSLDFTRGVFITLLLIGRLVSDPQFNLFNINVDIILLTIISGYCFDKSKSLKEKLISCAETIVPYLIFAVCYLIITPDKDVKSVLNSLINGSDNGEIAITAVAVALPCVYLLYLFITKLIYSLISQLKSNNILHIICFTSGFAGFVLIEKLPNLYVRVDYILIALMVYHISSEIRRMRLLEKAKELPFIYFLLSLVCCVVLLNDKADVSQRVTVDFGLTILSLFCEFTLVYLICTYINSRLPDRFNFLISLPGRSVGYILVISSLLNAFIISIAVDKLDLSEINIFYLAFVVIVEMAVGVVVYCAINGVKYILSKKVIK